MSTGTTISPIPPNDDSALSSPEMSIEDPIKVTSDLSSNLTEIWWYKGVPRRYIESIKQDLVRPLKKEDFSRMAGKLSVMPFMTGTKDGKKLRPSWLIEEDRMYHRPKSPVRGPGSPKLEVSTRAFRRYHRFWHTESCRSKDCLGWNDGEVESLQRSYFDNDIETIDGDGEKICNPSLRLDSVHRTDDEYFNEFLRGRSKREISKNQPREVWQLYTIIKPWVKYDMPYSTFLRKYTLPEEPERPGIMLNDKTYDLIAAGRTAAAAQDPSLEHSSVQAPSTGNDASQGHLLINPSPRQGDDTPTTVAVENDGTEKPGTEVFQSDDISSGYVNVTHPGSTSSSTVDDFKEIRLRDTIDGDISLEDMIAAEYVTDFDL